MSGTSSDTKIKRRRRFPWWQALLVLLLLGGGAYAYFERPWETKPTQVPVETVSSGPYTQVLAVNGRVVAREEVAVRAAVSAQALDVLADEGDTVEAGAVLVRLDTTQAQAMVDQARAALDAGLVRQTQAQANADRAEALGENATRSTREDAALELTGATTEVTRLQAALDQARSQLAQYTILAPLSGVVLYRQLDRGQLVDPQSELFTIANLSDLLVETDVDELYSAKIRTGLRALLRPVGDTLARDGSVVFAAPTVDPATGGRAIRIAFDEAADLPVGLTVNANIIVSEVEEALSVPRSAIVSEGTTSHVFVLEGGVVVAREIVFSDWPAERVVVTEGLSDGDAVLIDPGSVAVGELAVAE
jgi:membrane fusion protein (multidrug efflux system)